MPYPSGSAWSGLAGADVGAGAGAGAEAGAGAGAVARFDFEKGEQC